MTEQKNIELQYKILVDNVSNNIGSLYKTFSSDLLSKMLQQSSSYKTIINQYYYAKHSSYVDYIYSFFDKSLPVTEFKSDVLISSLAKNFAEDDDFKLASKYGFVTFQLFYDGFKLEGFNAEQHKAIARETYNAIKDNNAIQLLQDILDDESLNKHTLSSQSSSPSKGIVNIKFSNGVDMNCEELTQETTGCSGITILGSLMYCCHQEYL